MSVYTKGVTQQAFPSIPLSSVKRAAATVLHQRAAFIHGVMIAALFAFELFNYSTTSYALRDLLGDLNLAEIRWATILALAFCGMDFAGIAWLFTPKARASAGLESWYLIAAWFLAATMNALLTWWSVSLALLGHETLGNELITRQSLLHSAPVFVAALVWLLRILLIGSFALRSAGMPPTTAFQSDSHQAAAPSSASGRIPLRLVPTRANGRPTSRAPAQSH